MDERRFEEAMHNLGGPPVDPYDALEAVRPLLAGATRRRAATRASWLALRKCIRARLPEGGS